MRRGLFVLFGLQFESVQNTFLHQQLSDFGLEVKRGFCRENIYIYIYIYILIIEADYMLSTSDPFLCLQCIAGFLTDISDRFYHMEREAEHYRRN